MEAAITDFFHCATALHQRVTEIRDTQHLPGESKELALRSEFMDLTQQLELLVKVFSAANTAKASPPQQRLAKASWKIAQDLLVRLRRLQSTERQKTRSDTDIIVRFQTVFPESCIHNLGVRLHELREWSNHVRPINVNTLHDVTLELSKIDLGALVEENNADEAGTKAILFAKGVPSRTASAGMLKDFILESLSFKSMRNREEEVSEAHSSTFEWIFTRDNSTEETKIKLGNHFTSWLRSDKFDSIYWITGKPGSGKSTLVRYLSDHEATDKLLHEWAGDTRLAKATFYFWTSGSHEQRSQTGLLRYLLYQLLDFERDLIPDAFPDLWAKLLQMTTKDRIKLSLDWTVQELIDAFQRFISSAIPTMKIFLFVDGLDEFDGDHRSIIHFFKELVEGHNHARIKLCLSSRPWKVFEQAFETSVPNLKLQDLTFQDMCSYVSDKLHSNEHIRQILRQDALETNTLIRDTVNKADGVFLWARLVVGNILKAFGGSSTRIQEISDFTRGLPTDLEELFSQLLFMAQPSVRFSDISHIFQLMRAREIVAEFIKDESANALTIWEFALAMKASDDDLALERSPKEATDQEILDRCVATRSHLMDRTAGLLELYPDRSGIKSSVSFPKKESLGKTVRNLASNRVTYLHRTVRDYIILSPGIWSRLESYSSPNFDPHLRMLRCYVLRLKFPLEEIEHHRRHDEWWPDIALALTHSRYIDSTRDPRHFQTSLVNELNDMISFYWARRAGNNYDHWARSNFGSYEARKGNKIIFLDPFLALCTKLGLETYVLDRLDDMALLHLQDPAEMELEAIVEETPLLSYALEFLTSRKETIYPLSSPNFVHALVTYRHIDQPHLKRLIGTADYAYTSPMTKLKDVTPWIVTLRHLRDGKRRGWIQSFDIEETGTKRWTAVVKKLLEEGRADKQAIVKEDKWDSEVDARGVIVGILGDIGDYWICELGKLFEE